MSIPKHLFITWIGPRPAPMKYIDSWRKMNPSYEFTLIDNDTLVNAEWELADVIAAQNEWNGKADAIRWEVLWKYGGILVDADSECVRPLDDSFLEHDSFACYENEVARPGLVAAGYVGATKGNALMRKCMDACKEMNPDLPAWQEVGPGLLTRVAKDYPDLHIYPACTFIPKHYTGVEAPLYGPTYARQHWGTTRGYKTLYGNGENPVVSVIITCHKNSQYLAEAIESVKLQTLQDFEIIVGYSCSDCSEVAKPYVGKKLRIIGGLDKGKSHALNECIKQARGKYIICLDGDDQLAPDYLEKTVMPCERMALPYLMATTNMQEFGDRSGAWDLDILNTQLLQQNSYTCATLFTKKLWEDAGGFDVCIPWYEDWSFWISCAKKSPKAFHIQERLLGYRVHKESMTAHTGQYEALKAPMIRLRHMDLYRDKEQLLKDVDTIAAMGDDARNVVTRLSGWFPEDKMLRFYKCLADAARAHTYTEDFKIAAPVFEEIEKITGVA